MINSVFHFYFAWDSAREWLTARNIENERSKAWLADTGKAEERNGKGIYVSEFESNTAAVKSHGKCLSKEWCDIIDAMCECDIKPQALANNRWKNSCGISIIFSTFFSQNAASTQNNIACIFTHLFVQRLFHQFSLVPHLFVMKLIGATLACALIHSDYINFEIQIDLHYFIDMQIKACTQIGLDNMVRYLMQSSSFSLAMTTRQETRWGKARRSSMANQVAKSQFIWNKVIEIQIANRFLCLKELWFSLA